MISLDVMIILALLATGLFAFLIFTDQDESSEEAGAGQAAD